MASGPVIIPDKARLNILSATNLLNSANSFKLALVASSYTPVPSTMEVFSDVTGELATGGGYTAGGITLPNDVLTQSGATVKFSTDPATWTAVSPGIPAWRYGVIYAAGTLNGKINPIVGYFLGDATGIDYPLTSAGNPLTFTPNAAGIIAAA